ncbi:MAG: MATE family efflux transporter [Aquificaceae bacterium]|nr:MATE family efflux transporter [Aquificaceae bacterium]
MSVAVLLGFSYQTDGFFMALALAGIFLTFADVFDSIGVPQLVRARMQSQEEFKKLAGLLLTFTLVLSTSSTLLALLLAELVLRIPAGFSPQAMEATKTSYLLLLPYIFGSFLFHHFGAVLRSQRRFTQYFVGEFFISLANLVAVLLGLLLTKDYRVLPVSFSVAYAVGCVYMLYVGREHLHLELRFDARAKKLFFQFFQLALLYSILHLYILVDRAFASYLGEKAVSALTYGFLLAQIPWTILRFEHMAITSLAESEGCIKKLNFYLGMLFMFSLPFVVLFFALPWLPVKLLFGYGTFSKVDMELTSTALQFYALSIPFVLFWPVIYRVFQIKERLLEVGFVAFLGVVTNFVLNYISVFYLKMGLVGICLGTAGAYAVICSVGYLMLLRKVSLKS